MKSTYKIINNRNNETLAVGLTVAQVFDFIANTKKENDYLSKYLDIEPYTHIVCTLKEIPVNCHFVDCIHYDCNEWRDAYNVNGGYCVVDWISHDDFGATEMHFMNGLTIHNDWNGLGWYMITRDVHMIYD